ncbi:MAG: cyclic nucleotide-binding domain-containing protein [Anaerolineae bacterium]
MSISSYSDSVSRADILNALHRGLQGIDEAELDTLTDLASVCTYAPNTRLIHEDAIEDIFYFIVKGDVAVTVRVGADGERELGKRSVGQFFGEMALIDEGPRSASVTTLTETTTLELSASHFVSALTLCPNVALRIMRHVVSQLRHAIDENVQYYEEELAAARERETQLAQQVELLRIEIDQVRLQHEVHEVTDTDYFRTLRDKAGAMRERVNRDGGNKNPDRQEPS